MTKLFHVRLEEPAAAIAEAPFTDEVSDLESFVKTNPHMLAEQVTIIAEQVDIGPSGRIDLLAVDRSLEQGKLLLIELKNEPAKIDVLLQVLRYASWASINPDSIRLLLERGKVPAEKSDLTPRIVIVAPEITDELVELSQYVTAFEFSFLEVKRFRLGSEFLVAVDTKAGTGGVRPSVGAQEEWSWERYEADLGITKERIELAKWLVDQVKQVCTDKGWPLELKFRKGYTPFQFPGAWNVIGTENKWSKGWCIWFKMKAPPQELGLQAPSWATQTYWSPQWHQFYLNVTAQKGVNFQELLPFFEQAYAYVAELSGVSK